jgi:hypothetical protein
MMVANMGCLYPVDKAAQDAERSAPQLTAKSPTTHVREKAPLRANKRPVGALLGRLSGSFRYRGARPPIAGELGQRTDRIR